MFYQFKKNIIRYVAKLIIFMPYTSLIKRRFPILYTFGMYLRVKYREPEMNLLPLFCNKSSNSIDIGVLWGAYTFRLLKLSKTCYSFEANPGQMKFLKKCFGNRAKLFNEALSDHRGEAVLRVPDILGHSTIEESNTLQNRNTREVVVKTNKLDNHNLKNISFVKIDVEGHEPKVIDGMINTIQREKPVLFIEICKEHNPKSFSYVKEKMLNIGYLIYVYNNNNLIQPNNKIYNKHNIFIFIPEYKMRYLKNYKYINSIFKQS